MLSPASQRALFELIRAAIRAHLDGAPPPPLPTDDPAFGELRGAFVTLRSPTGELRGCIGHAVARAPLAQAVRALAVSAAAQDRRFPPVTRDELPDLQLELSVLTPLAPIQPEAVEVGTHGLMLRLQGRAGLLLPQVASERGWTATQFLDATCKKAGLPAGSYRDREAQLEGFTCDVYAE